MPLLLLAIRLGLLLPEPLRAQDTPSPVTRMAGGLYRETTATPYSLIEITLSGINQVFSEAGPNRLGAVYGAPNFGTIDVE